LTIEVFFIQQEKCDYNRKVMQERRIIVMLLTGTMKRNIVNHA